MSIIKKMARILPQSAKDSIKKTALYNIWRARKQSKVQELSPEYIAAQEMINSSSSMVDLGCGSSPHRKATVAVDKYIEPVHRKYGSGQKIEVAKIEEQGIKFVEADFEDLPFEDQTFDVAYSHHVVEHLDNPAKACKEMQRIARGGVIMCPSIFAEYMFTRKYHRWLVTAQANTLIFIEKDWDNLWFGEGPFRKDGKVIVPKDVNPFDILLNASHWYHGIHKWKRLTNLMRKYWFGHFKNMETCFVWRNSFDYLIIYKNGEIVSSR